MDIARLTWGHQIGHYDEDAFHQTAAPRPPRGKGQPMGVRLLARSGQERVAVRRTRGDSLSLWWFVW